MTREGTEKRSHSGKIYTGLLLAIFIALGAIVAGKISSNVREARARNEENEKLISRYTQEAEELSAELEQKKAEYKAIESRYQTVLGELKETDKDFYNLYNMYSGSLENSRLLAGLTTVSGRGIVIKLDDSGLILRSIVHDTYLMEILNVLKGAGAQAVAINGERIVPTSEVLCLGPSIRVNGTRLFAPYRITAIGDPDVLMNAYQNSRIYSTIVSQNLLYDVQKSEKIVITSFSGDHYKLITKLF